MEFHVERALTMIIAAFLLSMAFAPFVINVLYKWKIVRHLKDDFSSIIPGRQKKFGKPIMGGLIPLITVMIFVLFLWVYRIFLADSGLFPFLDSIIDSRSLLAPITVFLIMAILGGIDDVLNIFGVKRTIRTVKKQVKLAKVHKSFIKRIYYWITLPVTAYKNIWYALGSYPGKGIHAGEKIIIQLVAAGIAVWWIYFQQGISSVWLPWVGNVEIGIFMPVLITLAVVSTSNAVNFADGMDGLAAGTMLPAFLAFLVFAILDGQVSYIYVNSVVMGAMFTYLYFNIKPARIELGDVGSLSFGALLAMVALGQGKIMLLPVIGLVYVSEVASSFLQGVVRRLMGRRLFKMAPLHYHFQIIGWSEEKIVERFWILAIVCAVFGMWLGLQ
ncbi:hypothetical protein GF357_02600 [Candidatus Dojkabacteria bacterium]|nr:hypothetical protein [Candidatus Dojkabacteria bacterium]